ncbi:hypothetical protein KI387_010481, partial [Taxus chinensis]
MSDQDRGMTLRVMKLLRDAGWYHTLHDLEKETSVFFDIDYFGDLVMAGDLKEAESYVSCFTSLEDNENSTKMFYRMRKHKYFEALQRRDFSEAIRICFKELKVFSRFDKKIFQRLVSLLTLEDFRQHQELRNYGCAESKRREISLQLKESIVNNVAFKDKLDFPSGDSLAANPFMQRTPETSAETEAFGP